MISHKHKARVKEIEWIFDRVRYLHSEKPILKAVEIKRRIKSLIDADPLADVKNLEKQYEVSIAEYKESKIYISSYIQLLIEEYNKICNIQYRYNFMTGEILKC